MRYSLAHTLVDAINEKRIFVVPDHILDIDCGDGSKIKRAIPGEYLFMVSECISSCQRCNFYDRKKFKHKKKVGPFTFRWTYAWE